MQKALILLTAASVMLPSSGGQAARIHISPVFCPRGTGVTRDPFYDVRATQSRHGRGALFVRGQYRLLERSGRISLSERGRSSRLVRLDLRRRLGPNVRHRCVSFSGSFRPTSAHDVQLSDWRGRAIWVPIRRTR
jgi:hypothetical protein